MARLSYISSINYISSLILLSWWYLHSIVHVLHHQPGDLALQEEDLVTVQLTLAGWCHGTKRGFGPRWFIKFLLKLMLVSQLHVLHHQPDDVALQEVDLVTVELILGRLTSWYETGAFAPLVYNISYKHPEHTLTVVTSLPVVTWHCNRQRPGQWIS